MTCKHCGAAKQEVLQGDISLAFPGIKRVKQAPVYLCPQIQICLDCGAAVFFIPAQELELLRKGMTSFDSSAETGQS
jgi:hypothetical protein